MQQRLWERSAQTTALPIWLHSFRATPIGSMSKSQNQLESWWHRARPLPTLALPPWYHNGRRGSKWRKKQYHESYCCLTLLLVGGGANRPPGVFYLYQKPFALAPWNLGLFLTVHWAYCVKILTSYLAQRRLQGHFCGGTFRWTSSFPTFSADQRAAEACNSYWWYPSQVLCIDNYVTSLFNVTGTACVSIGGSREGNTGGITGNEQASLFGIPASAYGKNAFTLSLSLWRTSHTIL